MIGKLPPVHLYALTACVDTCLPLPCISNVNEYCQMIQGILYCIVLYFIVMYFLIMSLVLTTP